MTFSAPARTPLRRSESRTSLSPPPRPTVGLTVYGCGQEEAALFRELAPHLGVVPTITQDRLSEANVGLALGNRCISIGHKAQVANSTLLALSEAGVRYISTRSVGCDHIDVSYATSVGVCVAPVAYSPGSVADYTLMLILMAVRHARCVLRRADADDYRLPDFPGRELGDLTVGVIGTGRIGCAVMDRLRGFGCRTLAYDKRPKRAAHYVSLGELLDESDVVTLHAPLTADTHHLLDRGCIERMKRRAVIVNTGRGSLLDTEALVAALESGRLGGAALDVLEGEEGTFYADRRDKPVDNNLLVRLHKLPNVLITPHIAYYTDHALRDIVEGSIAGCVSFARGDRHA